MENTSYEWKSMRISCQDIDDIAALHRQLSSDAKPFYQSDLTRLVETGYLLIVCDQTTFRIDGKAKIVGMATLAPEYTLDGATGFIEDVVVNEAYQRRGVGRGLTERLIEKARQLGCRRIWLTSRPSRKPANRLYRRLGFRLIARARYPRAKYPNDTNLYQLDLI